MYIVHLGVSGFPKGNAAIQRILITFKAIKLAGLLPLIINKSSLNKLENAKRVGRAHDILYVNTSQALSRPDSFILRNINKITGIVFEFCFLLKRRKSIKTAIFYGSSFTELTYYSLLSKLFNFKLAIQYVEFRSSIPGRNKFFVRINDYLFDKYCFYICDGIIVISEFLKERSLSKVKSLPLVKIPAITDFSNFSVAPNGVYHDYLLYCGTIDYLPVIHFVIDLFEKLKTQGTYQGNLMLIIGGNNKTNFDDVKNRIEQSQFSSSFIFKVNVPHQNIAALYVGADVLLIPLRKTLQDIARFPHKISEYTASKVAILSTDVGDVGHYFQTGISAVLANEYSVDAYYNAISGYLSSKDDLKKIGWRGYQVGEENFNYLPYAEKLKCFINNL